MIQWGHNYVEIMELTYPQVLALVEGHSTVAERKMKDLASWIRAGVWADKQDFHRLMSTSFRGTTLPDSGDGVAEALRAFGLREEPPDGE